MYTHTLIYRNKAAERAVEHISGMHVTVDAIIPQKHLSNGEHDTHVDIYLFEQQMWNLCN